jgi:hypothetical protein
MKYKYLLIVLSVLLVTTDATAQRRKRKVAKADTALVVKNYKDSLTVLRARLDSLERVNDSLRVEPTDGRYYRLFAPLTFYHSGAHKQLTLTADSSDAVSDAIDEALMSLYMRRPDLVKAYESQLREAGTLRDDVNKEVKPQVEMVEIVEPVAAEPDVEPQVELVVQKPNFWTKKFDGSLQFLQNYVSDNWHKGGESNYSAVGSVTFELNYNDKDKVKFDNKLEAKLGFQTSRSDTVHKFKTNNDLLRLTSKLGLQAHKRWYYTLQVMAYTQFARGLKANDIETYSDFTSPFNLNVGLGMDYKVEALNKKLTGTINFSPLSYNFRYVDRLALATSYGLKEGHHSLHDFGSQMTADLEWKIAEQFTWKSRLNAYTSYKRAEIEWENLFTLKVSKYISANLFVYPRFDDAGKRDEDMGYFQFQEYSSLGISYSF